MFEQLVVVCNGEAKRVSRMTSHPSVGAIKAPTASVFSTNLAKLEETHEFPTLSLQRKSERGGGVELNMEGEE